MRRHAAEPQQRMKAMRRYLKLAGATLVAALALPATAVLAQVAPETVRSLSAPPIRSRPAPARWNSGTASRPRTPLRRSTTRWTSPTPSTSTTTASAAPRPRDRQGLRGHRRQARRRRHLLRADGFELAVPDRQRRHGLLPDRPRPEQRPDGDRAAVERGRRDQRHVVLLDHRHRRTRARSRARRQIPDRAAGL